MVRDIGLRAKVRPEIDEREAEREAGKLESHMQEAVEDLNVSGDVDDLIDDMAEGIERSQESFEWVGDKSEQIEESADAAGSTLEESVDAVLESVDKLTGGMGIAEGMEAAEGGRQGRTTPTEDKRSAYDEGMQESLSGFTEKASTLLGERGGRKAKSAGKASGKMSEMSSKLGSISGKMGGLKKMLMTGAAALAIVGLGLLALMKIWDGVEKLAKHSPLLATVVDMLGLAMSLFFRPFGNIIAQALLPLISGFLELAATFNKIFADQGMWAALGWLAQEIIIGLIDGFWAIIEWAVIALPMWLIQNLPQVLAAAVVVGLLILLSPILIPLIKIVTVLLLLLGLFFDTRDMIGFLVDVLQSMWDQLVALFSLIPKALLGALLGALLIALTVTGVLPFLAAIVGGILLLGALLHNIDEIVAGIYALAGIIADAIKWGLSAIVNGLVWAASGVWSILSFFARLMVMFVSWLWDKITWFFSAFRTVYEWFQDPTLPFDTGALPSFDDLKNLSVEDIIQGAIDLADWIGSGIGSLADWVTDGLGSLWDWVVGGTRPVWHWISGAGRDVWFWITDTSSDIWAWVTKASRDIWYWVPDSGRDIWYWMSDTGRDIWYWVSDNSRRVWHWITDNSRKVWHWLSDSSRRIWHWITASSRRIWHWIAWSSRKIWYWISNTSRKIWHWIKSTTEDLWDFVNIPNIDLGDYIDLPGEGATGAATSRGNDYLSRGHSYAERGYDYLRGGASAAGRVVRQPSMSALAESEPEVVVPFSKLDTFVQNMMAGQGPSSALPNPEGGSLPRLAAGGVVSDSTVAMIGEGSDDEAVLPLSRLESMIDAPDSPRTPTPKVEVNLDLGGAGVGGSGVTEAEVESAVSNALGDQLGDIDASVQELARKIMNAGLGGPIKITADGKVLAEVDEKGKDKYRRSREVNK